MKPLKFSGWNRNNKSHVPVPNKKHRRRAGTKKRASGQISEFQIELLEKRELLAANVLITEFLASNNNGLLDGYGNASDWIELHNSGDVAANLAGWHLTDNASNLNKWTFPAVANSIINPGEYRVVFASGTGVADPAGNLHTNFSLAASGEYLGLTRPDLSIVSEYGAGGTNYPPQFTDVSYGQQGAAVVGNLIRYIDADEAPGGNTAGLMGGWVARGAGAGQAGNNFANEGGALQADGATNVAQLATTTTGLDPNQNYEVYAFFWSAIGNNWNIEAGLTNGALTAYDTTSPTVFPINAATQAVGSNQRVSGLNVLGEGADDYTDWVDGNRVLYAVPLGSISGQTTITVYVDHTTGAAQRTWYDGIGVRGSGLLVGRSSNSQYWIPSNGNLDSVWTANGFNASANNFSNGFAAIGYEDDLVDNPTSYVPEILTAVPSGTRGVYVRLPFNLANASTISGLQLNVKYDDGFVAYVNGTQVAARNAPASPVWNSFATTSHPDAQALVYETISLAGFESLLVNGQNTLSIHALNLNNSTDFLMSPQLSFSPGGTFNQVIRYFETPTPGTLNGLGIEGFVADTKFSLKRGIYSAPINVTITTTTAGAAIYYTTDGSQPTLTNPTATLYSAPVAINKTTNLRAAAFKDGFKPTNVDTQSYVFVADVLKQDPLNLNGLGVSPNNGLTYAPTWQAGVTGDYAIDKRANPASPTYDAAKFPNLATSFSTLPTISITMNHNDVFGPTGINTDATKEGDAYRHPGSFEFFNPANGDSFQYDVGVQAHGSASRDNVRLLKHSFRLIFSNEFNSPGSLKYPLFDNSDFADINTIVLRASFTDSFATRSVTDRYNPLDSTYLRDVFMRDTQIAMGSKSADSTLAHLYINGLYWGVYSPTERVDDAFLASRLGGQREDWDIVRDFNELYRGNRVSYDAMMAKSRQIQSANAATANTLFQQIQGKNPDGTNDPNTAALLDADNFIDYMILHLYGSAEDWPSHNWVAARNRLNPDKGFQFFVWDQEIALDQTYRNKFGANNSNTPGELFQNLRTSTEFRLRFADRIQKHLFNNGALSTTEMQARWTKRLNQMAPAIVAESARWGDAREGQTITAYTMSGQIPTGSQIVPLMTVAHWQASMNYVRDVIFANARSTFLSRATSGSLFTTLAAPAFAINGTSQHGGLITGGSSLSMTGTGAIYYTLNGSDPRTTTGGIAGTAYTGPINLPTTTQVKARSFSGGVWSPVSEAVYSVAARSLVISEFNYNPYAPTTAELAINPLVVGDDFEFIELLNTSTTVSINLQGIKLANAVTYAFGAVTLAPGQRIVVVENVAAFQLRYGTSINVAGTWSGGLSNSGENIQLLDAVNFEIMAVNYNDTDPWFEATDGFGATVVLKDPTGTPTEKLGKYYSWRSSVEKGGTPGAASLAPRGVVINEIRSHTDLPQRDAIELFNPTGAAIDISGWYLSDSGNNPLKYQIPANTILGPGQYIVFDETHFNPTPASPGPNDFGLSAALGDEVYLTRTAAGGFIGFEDVVTFAATFNGDSLGRLPNGTGRLTRLTAGSFGAANGIAKVGPLVISEVNYHPANPSAAALLIEPLMTDNDLEFIEIHNPTGSSILTTNWRLRGEVDFDFPVASIAAGASWIVVSFNPTLPANANKLLAFRTHYGLVGSSITILGGFSGNLSNSSGRVTLQQPDSPPASSPTTIPRVMVDEVVYDDLAPWANADGNGNSLNRVAANDYGNLSTSWTANAPTPGVANLVAVAPQVAQTIRDGGSIVRPDLWSTYSVVFNANVNVTVGSLVMYNATLSGSLVDLAGITFNYNNLTFTATWNLTGLATPLDAAYYTVELNASSITAVNGGLALDGDANGTPGGNYLRTIYKAIPGDANLDGDVDISEFSANGNVGDLTIVKVNLGTTTGATWATGDFSGDGGVDVSRFNSSFQQVGDLSILYANLGRNVRPPAGAPLRGGSGSGGGDSDSDPNSGGESIQSSGEDGNDGNPGVSDDPIVSVPPPLAGEEQNIETVSITNSVPTVESDSIQESDLAAGSNSVAEAESVPDTVSGTKLVASEASTGETEFSLVIVDAETETITAKIEEPILSTVMDEQVLILGGTEMSALEIMTTITATPELVGQSSLSLMSNGIVPVEDSNNEAPVLPSRSDRRLQPSWTAPIDSIRPLITDLELNLSPSDYSQFGLVGTSIAPIFKPLRSPGHATQTNLPLDVTNATGIELGGSILVTFEKQFVNQTPTPAKTRMRDHVFAGLTDSDSLSTLLGEFKPPVNGF